MGRGGKRGKTSGRGTKGQNARAGRKKRPEMRDIIKRIPKLRGRGKNINTSIKADFVPINLGKIDTHFKAGEKVTPAILQERGIISTRKMRFPIKVLGTGEITKALTFSGFKFSSSAEEKISSAGGKIER